MARYRSYHGTSRRGVTVLIAVLILLLLAAAVVFLLPDFLVYSEDGTVHIDLPFLKGRPAQSQDDSGQINLIVESPPPQDTTEPSASPTETAVLRELPKCVFVPSAILNKPAQLQKLKAYALNVGATHMVLECKPVSGEIAGAEVVHNALAALEDPHLTPMAYISVFTDNKITRSQSKFGIKHTSGVNWLDAQSNRWINPFEPSACQWVIDNILTIKQLGFSEILLDRLSFPYNGNLNKIKPFTPATQSSFPKVDSINSFITSLSASCEGVSLSAFALPETVTQGSHPEAGQDLAVFERSFTAVFSTLTDDYQRNAPQQVCPVLSDPPDTTTLGQLSESSRGWLIMQPPTGVLD